MILGLEAAQTSIYNTLRQVFFIQSAGEDLFVPFASFYQETFLATYFNVTNS